MKRSIKQHSIVLFTGMLFTSLIYAQQKDKIKIGEAAPPLAIQQYLLKI